MRLEEISPNSSGVIVWGYAIKTLPVKTPLGTSCRVRASAYVKTVYEKGVYRFLECQTVQWSASGSSLWEVDSPSGNHIPPSADGRYLTVRGAFNISGTISSSLSAAYKAVGWSVGTTYIARIFQTPSITFDGNYAGAYLQ